MKKLQIEFTGYGIDLGQLGLAGKTVDLGALEQRYQRKFHVWQEASVLFVEESDFGKAMQIMAAIKAEEERGD